MRFIIPHDHLQALSGQTRVLFAVGDLLKLLDHEVTIIGDKTSVEPIIGEDVPPVKHYEVDELGDYYPLESLRGSDVEFIRGLFTPTAYRRYLDCDVLWSFRQLLHNVETHIETPIDAPKLELPAHWVYQDWPVRQGWDKNMQPHKDAVLYTNSAFTAGEIWKQYNRSARLLHPPLPLHRYNNTYGYNERDIDIIYLGRVDPFKLGDPPLFKRFPDARCVIVGSDWKQAYKNYDTSGYEWIKNATFNDLADYMSRARVYIHFKGLINRNDPEHYGITCAEAIAAGIPTIVPKVGGPYTDISDFGRYCIPVDTVDDAIHEAQRLLSDKDYWNKWHLRALEGAVRFDYSQALVKLEHWIEAEETVNK